VTRPATDDPGHGSPGKARKRIADLLRDARQVQPTEDGWLIVAPMDRFWQHWLRIDKEWAALETWKYKDL